MRFEDGGFEGSGDGRSAMLALCCDFSKARNGSSNNISIPSGHRQHQRLRMAVRRNKGKTNNDRQRTRQKVTNLRGKET